MLKLCLAQMDVKLGDRDRNFAAAEEWTETNAALLMPKGDDCPSVIVLPEMFDVGYVIDEAAKYADEGAELALGLLSRLARRFGVWFAGGSVLARDGDSFVNRALVVAPDGSCAASYDKAHLVPLMDEEKYLAAGSELCVVEIGGVKCQLAVCYDLRFCEWLRMGALAGAELAIISAEWPDRRIEHWSALLRARAIENMMFVAGCNRVGLSPSARFGGRSAVIDPWGAALWEGGEEEASGFVTIDPAESRKARSFIRAFDMRRPELYRL